ncbi:MAG: hypothetical protein V4687_19060 [Bacteroidota bacterium]
MKRFLIGLLLAFPALCTAQSNFQRGYIVNNAKDTLEGYIDYKPQVSTPTTFKFKPGENAALQTMTLENCRAFCITGYEKFERFSISQSTSVQTPVFLKVVLTGANVSLYAYKDSLKERFFLKGSGVGEPYELILDNGRYKGQLLFEMRNRNIGTDYYEGDMESLKYDLQELSKMVSIMNREVVRVAKKNSRIFIGAGITNTVPGYTGQHPLSNGAATETSSIMPSVSLGVDIFNGSTSGLFVYRAEVSAYMGKDLKIMNGNTVHSFDHLTLSLSPKIMVNLYNTEKLKGYIGAGGSLNYSSFSNNKAGIIVPVTGSPDQFIPSEIALVATTFSYNVNAGVLIKKKFEVGLTYTPPYSISNYNAFALKIGIMQAGIKYHLGK